MRKVPQKVIRGYEKAALAGAEHVLAVLSGKVPESRLARIGLGAMMSYTSLRGNETRRMAVQVAAQRIGIGVDDAGEPTFAAVLPRGGTREEDEGTQIALAIGQGSAGLDMQTQAQVRRLIAERGDHPMDGVADEAGPPQT